MPTSPSRYATTAICTSSSARPLLLLGQRGLPERQHLRGAGDLTADAVFNEHALGLYS